MKLVTKTQIDQIFVFFIFFDPKMEFINFEENLTLKEDHDY